MFLDKRIIRKIGCAVYGLLLLLTVVIVQAQTPTPNPDTLMQDCTRNLSADRSIATGPDAPSIKIIAPATGTVIVSNEATLADVNFTVEVQNWNLPGYYSEQEAPHWHLWLNDSVWGMFYQTDALSGVPYGTWRICASLGDANHVDVGMPDAILLTVKRQDSQTASITVQPTAAVQISPPTSAPEQPPILLIIVLGIFALIGGLMLGRRARKSS